MYSNLRSAPRCDLGSMAFLLPCFYIPSVVSAAVRKMIRLMEMEISTCDGFANSKTQLTLHVRMVIFPLDVLLPTTSCVMPRSQDGHHNQTHNNTTLPHSLITAHDISRQQQQQQPPRQKHRRNALRKDPPGLHLPSVAGPLHRLHQAQAAAA